MDKERLNKYLASCGICSRREADRLIEDGKVTVNGEKAMPGMKVGADDRIVMNGKQVHGKNEKVVLAYYKPIGVVCTEKDRFADKKITDMVRFPVRVTYAGRLDKDSEGLILLTNDGELIDAMMRGSNHHEKEYVVKVNREISDAFLQGMESGVYLTDLDVKTRPCRVEKVGKNTFKIILTQGVNRQIKRMVKEMGYRVVAIKRIRVMNVRLSGLIPGQYRQLSDKELQVLYNSCFGEEVRKNTKSCAHEK